MERPEKAVGTMENYPIKSVTFGGFDKQDVVAYIERTAQAAAAAEQALREEGERLRGQAEEQAEEIAQLRRQLAEMTEEKDALQSQLEQETAARQALEPLRALEGEAARLREELEALRPDAEAYAQFRARIGAIECEARERAAHLEAETAVRLRRTVDTFRGQYLELMHTFEGTAGHVTAELRKVEVNLTQLPRAMDQAGRELNELAALLEKQGERA